MVFRYLQLFLSYIKMLNVRLAGGHLYGKQLFTWLSLMVGVFDVVFLCCLFFLLDVLDEIWDVIESVLRDFLSTLQVPRTSCFR